MARRIVVSEESYEAVKRLKCANETYSDLFLRISPPKKYITDKDLRGILGNDPEGAVRLRKELTEYRKELNRDAESREKRIWGRK